MTKMMLAHRVILDHLTRNGEDNLGTLVNAYQVHGRHEPPPSALHEAIDAIVDLGEGGQLEAWLNDPRQPLQVPQKVDVDTLRDRVTAEARGFSWDATAHRWTSDAGLHGQEPYLWFSIKTA